MDHRRIAISGRQIYVESHGDPEGPPLLYLHGGPGEGAYEFLLHQGGRLSQRLHLISLDQRGVWRSDALSEGERLSPRDLIDDFEALRRHLGISQWSVLGHSFGAYLAVHYALSFPSAVSAVILEGATLDLADSMASLLQCAAALFDRRGDVDQVRACDAAARHPDPDERLRVFLDVGPNLGKERGLIYLPSGGDNYGDLPFARDELEQYWVRSAQHLNSLRANREMYQSLLPRLQELDTPICWIQGELDPVATSTQLIALKASVPLATVIIFPGVGHLPHYEAADAFAERVFQFLGADVVGASNGGSHE